MQFFVWLPFPCLARLFYVGGGALAGLSLKIEAEIIRTNIR